MIALVPAVFLTGAGFLFLYRHFYKAMDRSKAYEVVKRQLRDADRL
jgi:hypothetical protein